MLTFDINLSLNNIVTMVKEMLHATTCTAAHFS